MECSGPHTLGIEFLRHVIEESIRVRYAHAKARATLLKARLPEQHNGMGVAGATRAPGGTRGNPAGAPRLTAVAWWMASRSPPFPAFRR